jgi:hypothetical protein
MTAARFAPFEWVRRWWSVAAVALAATAVTAYPTYAHWPPIRADGAGYHIWNYALLKGDLSFSWFSGEPSEVALHRPDPLAARFASKYPPGVALLRLPVMALVTDAARGGPPFTPAEHWACLALGAAALVAAAALTLATCRRLGVPSVWGNVAVVLLTFGTGLYHYGTCDAGYSHVYSALLAATLMWLAVRAGTSDEPLPVLRVASLVALLLLVRTTNVVLIGSWVLACAAGGGGTRSPHFVLRAFGAAAAGVLVGLIVTLAVNHQMFGRFTFDTYPGERFHWNEPHVLDVLGGEEFGLFRAYPVLGVALLAALAARRTRRAALGLALPFAAYTVLYGHWWTWHLGDGFGHRGFVELVPFTVPVFAAALAALGRRTARVVAGVGAIATIYTIVYMCLYWGNRDYRVATF